MNRAHRFQVNALRGYAAPPVYEATYNRRASRVANILSRLGYILSPLDFINLLATIGGSKRKAA